MATTKAISASKCAPGKTGSASVRDAACGRSPQGGMAARDVADSDVVGVGVWLEKDHSPNVTTRPANRTQSGGRRARPCRRVVLSGSTRPGRKPRRAHTHGGDRRKTPPATNTSCVTGSYFPASQASRQDSRHALLSCPFPSDPPKTTLRHPQRTLRKPSPHGPWGPSQRRAAEASDTALSIGGGRVLRDTLAASRCQGAV